MTNLYRSGFTAVNNHRIIKSYMKLESPSAAELSAQCVSDGYDEFTEAICQTWLDAPIWVRTKYPTLAQQVIQTHCSNGFAE